MPRKTSKQNLKHPYMETCMENSNVNQLIFLFGTQEVVYVLRCLVESHADDGD